MNCEIIKFDSMIIYVMDILLNNPIEGFAANYLIVCTNKEEIFLYKIEKSLMAK